MDKEFDRFFSILTNSVEVFISGEWNDYCFLFKG